MASSSTIISKQIQYIVIVITEPQQEDLSWRPAPARDAEPPVVEDDRTDLAEEDTLLPLADLDLRLVELEGQLADLNARSRLEALESRFSDLNTRLQLTPVHESVNNRFKCAAEEQRSSARLASVVGRTCAPSNRLFRRSQRHTRTWTTDLRRCAARPKPSWRRTSSASLA